MVVVDGRLDLATRSARKRKAAKATPRIVHKGLELCAVRREIVDRELLYEVVDLVREILGRGGRSAVDLRGSLASLELGELSSQVDVVLVVLKPSAPGRRHERAGVSTDDRRQLPVHGVLVQLRERWHGGDTLHRSIRNGGEGRVGEGVGNLGDSQTSAAHSGRRGGFQQLPAALDELVDEFGLPGDRVHDGAGDCEEGEH